MLVIYLIFKLLSKKESQFFQSLYTPKREDISTHQSSPST